MLLHNINSIVELEEVDCMLVSMLQHLSRPQATPSFSMLQRQHAWEWPGDEAISTQTFTVFTFVLHYDHLLLVHNTIQQYIGKGWFMSLHTAISTITRGMFTTSDRFSVIKGHTHPLSISLWRHVYHKSHA